MAQIIRLNEIAAARDRNRRQVRDRASLEGAVSVLKENLAAAANRLCEAAPAEQEELIARIERLTALIRYGTRMMGDAGGGFDAGPAAGDGPR